MPWLGDGTWVEDANVARGIVNGRLPYRPWSGDTGDAHARALERVRSTHRKDKEESNKRT